MTGLGITEREIGQLFFVGFHGTRLTAEIRDFLHELNPSGVVLFSRNVEDPVQVACLNEELQKRWNLEPHQGLIIAVDQEGGRVARLRAPFTEFPPAMELASHGDASARVLGFAETTARELRLVGFNLDFAPVLDVPSSSDELDSTVIGDRAFGLDPEIVSAMGNIVIRGLRAGGVIPCGKHFPGHGGTLIDSHQELPVDRRPLSALEPRDLAPFRAAIDLNVEMLMTAHVLYPALEETLPATLSKTIIDGILRRDLGHEGLVITDDLDMKAISEAYSPAEYSVAAIEAGVDLIMICNSPEKAPQAKAAIVQALNEGRIDGHRILRALERLNRLKRAYASSLGPCDPKAARDYFGTASSGRNLVV